MIKQYCQQNTNQIGYKSQFFKALIDSVINYNKFVLINNVLKEHDKMKEKIKHLKVMSSYWLKCTKIQKVNIQKM